MLKSLFQELRLLSISKFCCQAGSNLAQTCQSAGIAYRMCRRRVLFYRLNHYIRPLHLRAFTGNANRQYLCIQGALYRLVAMKLAAPVTNNNYSVIRAQGTGIVDEF